MPVLIFLLFQKEKGYNENKTDVIHDLPSQTNSPVSSDQKFALFYKISKVGNNGRTDDMCENDDHYHPLLCVSRVDLLSLLLIDPPRPNRWSLFSDRVSVRPSQKQKRYHWPPENKTRAITVTMCIDNDHLLAVAWWVTMRSEVPRLVHHFVFDSHSGTYLKFWACRFALI